MIKNYYEVLGVNRNATKDEIKSAYIKALKKFHPDVYTGSEQFAQNTTALLNEAYEVLKDDEKRKNFDQSLYRSSVCITQNYTNTNTEPVKKTNEIFEDFKSLFRRDKDNSNFSNNNSNIHQNNNIKKENKTKINKTKIKKENKIKKSKTRINKGNSEINEDGKDRINLRIYLVLILIVLLMLIIMIF